MIFGIFRVSGHSMEPTIHNGGVVLVSGIPYLFSKPKVGDTIAFRESSNGKILLKRIIRIKENKYFVRGDNRSDSRDSRKFGFVNKEDIIGKVIKKL